MILNLVLELQLEVYKIKLPGGSGFTADGSMKQVAFLTSSALRRTCKNHGRNAQTFPRSTHPSNSCTTLISRVQKISSFEQVFITFVIKIINLDINSLMRCYSSC